jgi:soluble lytic murein transglycosylase
MKVALSHILISRLALRCLTSLLLMLMVLMPAGGQSVADLASGSASSASSAAKVRKAAKQTPEKTEKQSKVDKEAAKPAHQATKTKQAAKPAHQATKTKQAAKPATSTEEQPAKSKGKAGKKAAKSASQMEEQPAKTTRQTEEKTAKSKETAGKKATRTAGRTEENAARPASTVEEKAAKPMGKAGKKTASQTEVAEDATPAKDKAARLKSPAGNKSKKNVKRASKAAQKAQTARIKRAFVASAELRPMAQQLAAQRTPAAYAGVTQYAHKHSGAAAAAAYLALGHASLLDNHYEEAAADFRLARRAGEELADYADFLGARANHGAGNEQAAEELLRGFADRYPESVFAGQAPELEAGILLGMKDAAGAERVLAAALGTDAALRPGFQLVRGETAFMLGEESEAARIYKRLLLSHPLSAEAGTARAKLATLGAEAGLSRTELRSLGDAYYNAGRYANAEEQYRALAGNASLDAASRNGFAVAAAACELKLKRLTTAEAEALADTPDENGARRLYLLMELARNRNDLDEQKRIVAEMEERFPQSQWLAEALYSSGNMYLLRREYPVAATYYGYLAAHFPASKKASAAHWKAGWLSYRQEAYADAARLFDEQIQLYPTSAETAAALYWRGRLYETQEHNPARAAANYRALLRAYPHYFYAQMARQRLTALGDVKSPAQPASEEQLERFQALPAPELMENFPIDSPHLAKARLLANAGLNEYIAQEIAADPDSSSWNALAEAQIYASYGETFRALRALKRALPSANSASIESIPLAYWRILFPKPWWATIKAESAKNGLDPYLVASVIRQESEFNPSAVSRANAYGLMQVLPSVGRELARQEGMGRLDTVQLLDPVTNIRLGTRYLRQTLERFGGVTEYALAAYNAGDGRVVDWQAAGPYQGMDEFVESIPFTETREYVEAILRNAETYKAIDAYAASRGKAWTGQY